jgi:dTDP-4-amino-4,6-dideoxygalactose transaminase
MLKSAAAAKVAVDDLAIFGGVPAFTGMLHVGRPNVGNPRRLLERMSGILERRWLTNDGPLVQELEARLASHLGVGHCVCVSSGTIGLQIAAAALGLEGEVILPAFTFVATAHALRWMGLAPVFCDVDAESHLIDPVDAERRITPRTTAVLGVHVWGRACPVEALGALAARHRIALLFDAAHAFGCSHRGALIGGLGRCEIFSFHATKVLNTFEGGAITTHDEVLAARLRQVRNFGFTGHGRVVSLGTNGKMIEPAAAMGLTSLESLEEFIAANRRNHEAYRTALATPPGLRVMTYPARERHNFHYVVLEVDEARAGLSRDELLEILHAENVLARRYYSPGCHRLPPYAPGPALPQTERLAERVMALPTGTAVGPDEIERIGEIIRLSLANAAAIRARWAQRRALTAEELAQRVEDAKRLAAP